MKEIIRLGEQGKRGFLISSRCIVVTRGGKVWTTTGALLPRFTHFVISRSDKKEFIAYLYSKSNKNYALVGTINIYLGKHLEYVIKIIPLLEKQSKDKVINKKRFSFRKLFSFL